MHPGPLGPHLPRGKLEANSRIGRYIFWDFYVEIHLWWKTDFLSFLFLKMNSAIRFLFKKASFRHFARNVTIVSPNGGPGGTNHSKCEKTQLSIFLPQSHMFAPKVHFGVIFSFLSYFYTFGSKWPKKHQETITPTSFWATGPKKRILSSKMRKMLKILPNAIFFSKFN